MHSPVPDKIRIPDALWQGLAPLGLARADVVRHARLPLGVVRGDAPVTTAQFFALWQSLIDLSNDPVIGFRIATVLGSGGLPASFLAAFHARDFRDALQRVARFKGLCAPEQMRIEERGGRCEIATDWLHAPGQAVPPALVDATFVSFLELGRKGTATHLVPMALELARPERARAELERYFGCAVRFDAKRDCMTLHSRDLDRLFVSYNAEMLDILVPELDRRLDHLAHAASVTDQTRWVLRRRLTAGRPDIRSVAIELAMSERSLQRKLTGEGQTFQGLLSQTRHQLALEHLADTSLTLIEVAYLLGYEDQNSFFRAFRQWEEQTPSAWRATRSGERTP